MQNFMQFLHLIHDVEHITTENRKSIICLLHERAVENMSAINPGEALLFIKSAFVLLNLFLYFYVSLSFVGFFNELK